MDIWYTDHAEDALRERKIPRRLVEQAILKPDRVSKGRKRRIVAHKLVGKKLLRVIYTAAGKAYIVVTAYFTRSRGYNGLQI